MRQVVELNAAETIELVAVEAVHRHGQVLHWSGRERVVVEGRAQHELIRSIGPQHRQPADGFAVPALHAQQGAQAQGLGAGQRAFELQAVVAAVELGREVAGIYHQAHHACPPEVELAGGFLLGTGVEVAEGRRPEGFEHVALRVEAGHGHGPGHFRIGAHQHLHHVAEQGHGAQVGVVVVGAGQHIAKKPAQLLARAFLEHGLHILRVGVPKLPARVVQPHGGVEFVLAQVAGQVAQQRGGFEVHARAIVETGEGR